MSEQSKIIAEMEELIMGILKTGSATPEQGNRIDELEDMMHEQKCYEEIENSKNDYQGEEIASLFFTNNSTQAIEKMIECGITPEDFFGFVNYHYDDEHEDEELAEMFTIAFITEVTKEFEAKS